MHRRAYFWTYPWPTDASARLQAYLAGALPLWDDEDMDWAPPDQARAPRDTEIVSTAQRVGRAAYEAALVAGEGNTPRRVYIFFAGHGLRAKEFGSLTEQTCFVARNFRLNSSNNVQGLVACESLRKALLSNRFSEAILFLDCCRLRTSRLTMTAVPITDFSTDPTDVSWGVGHAAQDNAVAYETVGAPIRGAFTKTLTQGLRTLRHGANHELHVEALAKFVQDNIARCTDSGQSPSFLYVPNPPGPVIVRGAVAAGAALAASSGPMVDTSTLVPGTQVLLRDGVNALVANVPPIIAGPNAKTLPPIPDGLYSLEVVGAGGEPIIFKQPRVEPIYVT